MSSSSPTQKLKRCCVDLVVACHRGLVGACSAWLNYKSTKITRSATSAGPKMPKRQFRRCPICKGYKRIKKIDKRETYMAGEPKFHFDECWSCSGKGYTEVTSD